MAMGEPPPNHRNPSDTMSTTSDAAPGGGVASGSEIVTEPPGATGCVARGARGPSQTSGVPSAACQCDDRSSGAVPPGSHGTRLVLVTVTETFGALRETVVEARAKLAR